MQDLWDIVNLSDFVTELIFAFVSLIIGILIYIIDRRGNKRQEEALDIILDQVSKVNQFQTRSLVLAIDTLESELNDIKRTVTNNQEILKTQNLSIKPSLTTTPEITKTQQSQQPGLTEVISKKFSQVITDQVDNLLSGIQEDLKELQTSTPKEETYKKKKGLEFDVKSLLRNLEGLEDLKIDYHTSPKKKPRVKVESIPTKSSEDSDIIEPEIVETSQPKGEIENLFKTEQIKEKFEKFEDKLEKVKSVGDLENIVNSLTEMFTSKDKNKSKKRKKAKPDDFK
ncbi:MAG: hypothetical protein ACW981_15170 [Candidatus Hodarchaeales archaeon]|jgi:hypothetical protein